MATISNTTLNIGMLVVPVGLKKMSESQDVKLDRASEAGNLIGRSEFDKVTGEKVDEDHPAQYGKFENLKDGTGFRPISQNDLDAIESATKIDSFEIEHFVPLADVPFERATAAYYIVPQAGVSAKPLAILHEALRKTKRAGVFKLCLRSRQYLAVIYAKNGALYINLLTFAADFARAREAQEVIASAEKPSAAVARQAEALIEAYSADADVIDTLEDDLIPLKRELVAQALAGKGVERRKAAAKKATTDSFEDALRESVKEAQARKKREKVKA